MMLKFRKISHEIAKQRLAKKMLSRSCHLHPIAAMGSRQLADRRSIINPLKTAYNAFSRVFAGEYPKGNPVRKIAYRDYIAVYIAGL